MDFSRLTIEYNVLFCFWPALAILVQSGET